MRKGEVPKGKLFCEVEAFLKQIVVFVAISKAGKTSNFFVKPRQG